MKFSKLYTEFLQSEKIAGVILLGYTLLSIILSNTSFSSTYIHLWHGTLFSHPIEFWVNDVLMTFFFLMVGLEIEREIYIGELSNIKKASLPIIAAIGGMLIPAAIHFTFNHHSDYQNGYAIPMATDIAFSLAILSLLGNTVPLSIKIFLTALAIIDDLGSIIVIATCYSNNINQISLLIALGIFAVMLVLNRFKIFSLWPYLLLGIIMWIFVYQSGIHPTITGILVAFAIPFQRGEENSISYKLQHFLHHPIAFIVLPLFALANTAILLPSSVFIDLINTNSIGIVLGLLIGKPLGIFLFSMLGIGLKICSLPKDVSKINLWFVGCLAGIGFTMSIFISLLAFNADGIITQSKIAIIIGSLLSGVIGFIGLKKTLK